jgi:hypothetical protein
VTSSVPIFNWIVSMDSYDIVISDSCSVLMIQKGMVDELEFLSNWLMILNLTLESNDSILLNSDDSMTQKTLI